MTSAIVTKAIEPDDNLQRTMDTRPRTVRVFVERRMACPGCAMAPFETVAEAARAYDLSPDDLLADLRRADAGEPDGP